MILCGIDIKEFDNKHSKDKWNDTHVYPIGGALLIENPQWALLPNWVISFIWAWNNRDGFSHRNLQDMHQIKCLVETQSLCHS